MSESRKSGDGFESSALVEAAFYEAFANLDLRLMSEIWLQSDSVFCIHPSAQPILGFDAIQESWRSMFQGGQPLRLFYRVLKSQMDDGMAIHLVEEELSAADGRRHGLVISSNCYVKSEGGWRLFSHHGSPMLVPKKKRAQTPSRIH